MSRIVFVVSPLHTKTPGNLSSSTLYSSCALCLHHLFRTNLLLRTLAECAIFSHFMPLKFTEKKKKNETKKKTTSTKWNRKWKVGHFIATVVRNMHLKIVLYAFVRVNFLQISTWVAATWLFFSPFLSSKLNTNCKRQKKKKTHEFIVDPSLMGEKEANARRLQWRHSFYSVLSSCYTTVASNWRNVNNKFQPR